MREPRGNVPRGLPFHAWNGRQKKVFSSAAKLLTDMEMMCIGVVISTMGFELKNLLCALSFEDSAHA